MTRRTGRAVLCQQAAVSLLLLVLLLAPEQAQAQARPGLVDTSWIPATNTANQRPTAAAPSDGSGRRAGAVAAGPLAGAAAATGTRQQQPVAAGVNGADEDPAPAAGGGSGTSGAAKAPRPAGTAAPGAAGSNRAGAQGAKPRARAAAANPAGSLHNVLAKNAPLFRSLLTVLDISPEQVSPNTVGTFFAPTDEAIAAFLQDMGLTAKQLAARPELVDLIVSYHFAPGVQLQGTEDVGEGSKILLTGDEQFIMNISSTAKGSGGKLALTDVQRSKANVLDGPFVPEATSGLSVFVIDKVLRSGNYFLTIASALSHSPYWITAKDTAVKANVLRQLEGQPVTLFVPDNAAFKPLESNLSRASIGRLAEILQYHVLPKVRRLPKGFELGPADTLLKGHSVDINITSEMQRDPFSGNKNKTVLVPLLSVSPEVGRPAKVTYYNIYAGPAILHGISGLLMPDLPQDPNELPPLEDEQQPPDASGPAGAGEQVGLAGPDSVDGAGAGDGVQDGPTPRMPGGGTAGAAGAGRAGSAAAAQGPRPARLQAPGMTPAPAGAAPSGGAGGNRGSVGLPTPGLPVAAGIKPPSSSGNSAGAARRRPPAASTPKTAVDAGVTEEAGTPGGRRLLLLQLPRSMLAAGLQTARRLLTGRVLAQAGRPGGPAKPKAAAVTPSGALSSVAGVGAVGQLQSFANGIASNKTLTALRRAAVPQVPKQYVNRYGGFKGADVRGGCLNCKAWGKAQPSQAGV